MAWVLDDSPFQTLVSAKPQIDLSKWPQGELFVAPATAAKAPQDRRRQAALEAKSSSTGTRIITVFDFSVQSPAGDIFYHHLRKPPKNPQDTKDLAEHQSVAWVLANRDRDVVLVTQDKTAAYIALSELGRSKVCLSFELWHHLFTADLLNRNQYGDLMDLTRRNCTQGLPGFPWRFLPLP